MALLPNDLKMSETDIQVAALLLIKKFDEKLMKEHPVQSHFFVVVSGEYDRLVLNQVEKEYMGVGWKHARCKTSSENGERPGLTALELWRIKDVHTEHCFPGSCKYGEDDTCTVHRVPPTHTKKEIY